MRALIVWLALCVPAVAAELEVTGPLVEHTQVRMRVTGIDEGTKYLVFFDVFPYHQVDLVEVRKDFAVFTGPPGDYDLSVKVAFLDDEPYGETLRRTITIAARTPPPPPEPEPPEPTPDPEPEPDPDPVVRVDDVARVLVVYDAERPMPRGPMTAIASQAFLGWLNANVPPDGNGIPAWRQWDDDTDPSRAPDDWRLAWQKAAPPDDPPGPIVYVFDSEGDVDSFAAPDDPAELIAALEAYDAR